MRHVAQQGDHGRGSRYPFVSNAFFDSTRRVHPAKKKGATRPRIGIFVLESLVPRPAGAFRHAYQAVAMSALFRTSKPQESSIRPSWTMHERMSRTLFQTACVTLRSSGPPNSRLLEAVSFCPFAIARPSLTRPSALSMNRVGLRVNQKLVLRGRPQWARTSADCRRAVSRGQRSSRPVWHGAAQASRICVERGMGWPERGSRDHVFPGRSTAYGPEAAEFASRDEACDYCAHLTATHYENFSVVTWLTPREHRPALQSIYAFCRWSDDLGDEIGDPCAIG